MIIYYVIINEWALNVGTSAEVTKGAVFLAESTVVVLGKIVLVEYLAYHSKLGTPLTTILPSTIVCRKS